MGSKHRLPRAVIERCTQHSGDQSPQLLTGTIQEMFEYDESSSIFATYLNNLNLSSVGANQTTCSRDL